MERQTNKRVELYAEQAAYGEDFPENGTPFKIDDEPPSEGELRTAVSQLSHRRCGGASGILAEHIKTWLRGAKKAEPGEWQQPRWQREDVGRVRQALLIRLGNRYHPSANVLGVTVLIPKGGGEYWGIGLLEPI